MTVAEVNAAIESNLKKYNEDAAELRRKWLESDKKVLDEWAKEHADFAIGDVIKYTTGSCTCIRVDRIYGQYSKYNHAPYVCYGGDILNAKLLPKKVGGGYFTMYADGREIEKIK